MAIVYSRQFQVDLRCPVAKELHTLTSIVNNLHLKRRRRNSALRNGGPVPTGHDARSASLE